MSLYICADNITTKSTYRQTSPRRPPWGQKKVAVVEKRPLWGGRGVEEKCLSC